jgi:hypothetical protein
MNLIKVDNNILQKKVAHLEQEKHHQAQEIKLLKQRLTILEAGMQDDAINDLNYDSSDNDSEINSAAECANGQEEGGNKATTNKQDRNQHHSTETYTNPNYNLSDNEDPRNDIYLD